jgi:hypothetical protein
MSAVNLSLRWRHWMASRLPEEYPGWMTKMMARHQDHMQQ